MPNVPLPPPGAQYGKVFLLPLASEMDRSDFFSQALPYILLDLFSDFDVAEDDLPDLSDQNKLNQWFEFERLEGVMDYSTGNIRTALYQF